MSVFKDQAEFMKACGQTVGEFNLEQMSLYSNLVHEEFNELVFATSRENELKELMDLMVVLIGYGLSQGWDLEGADRKSTRLNSSH